MRISVAKVETRFAQFKDALAHLRRNLGAVRATAGTCRAAEPPRIPAPSAALAPPPTDAGPSAALEAATGRLRSESQELAGKLKVALKNETSLRLLCIRYAAAFQNMPSGLIWLDSAQRLVMCNDNFLGMYGLPPEHKTEGTPIEAIVAGGDFPENLAVEYRLAIAKGQSWTTCIEMADGRHLSICNTPLPDGGTLGTHSDISAIRQLEKEMVRLARHDTLTGLLNRYGLNLALQDAIHQMERGAKFSLLTLDLDHFKQVNDTLGHPVGDQLLQEVGQRLRGCVRRSDVIARLGGDEFAILQRLSELPSATSSLAARVISELTKPYEVAGHRIIVGASIGIVLAPSDGTDKDTLLKNADLALYRSKMDGRGVFRFYEPEMDARMQARRKMELDLRQALPLDQFEVHYQPLINVASGAISGFEALLRWQQPERGMISPAEFIPLAEELRLMPDIGAWVLRRACRDAVAWPDRQKIAVNVSAAQFRTDGLYDDVCRALAETGIEPERLELEITETVLLESGTATIELLHRLRNLGIKIAMDDFGTGYSSLSYLSSFPFDKIKIDRSFTSGAKDNDKSAAIVRAVVGLGSSLGMSTTAEGVETLDQITRLKAQGCTELQGYYFSRPIPAHDIPALLARHDQALEAVA